MCGSGWVVTGGRSMLECGGESSSFFMASNLILAEPGGWEVPASNGSGCSSFSSSFISMVSVGVGSQSGDSYSML